MFKPLLIASSMSTALLLTACGGGGGSSSTPTTPASTTVTKASVAGPLDPVQTQVSSTVFDPLAGAVSSTGLEPVVSCANTIVNGDVLDIADTVLVSLQSTAANPGAADPQAVADSLRSMVVDLTQLIQGMAGQAATCATSTLSVTQVQSALHLLDNTPLAPLATQLEPVLTQIIGTVGTQPGGSTASLSTVSGLVDQLDGALQSALAQIPSTAYQTPIVGGALTTLSIAVTDTGSLLHAVLAQNTAAASTAVQKLVQDTLTNLMTLVVPLNSLAGTSGTSNPITGQISSASQQLSALLGGSVGHAPTGGFNTQLLSALVPVLAPIQNQLLPTILGPITDALAGGTAGASTGGALAGSPLAPVVNQLSGVLTQLTGGIVPGAGAGSGGSCVFASLPALSVLCGKG